MTMFRPRGDHDRGYRQRSRADDHLTDREAIDLLARNLIDLASRMRPESRIAARFRASAAELRVGPEVK